LVAGKTKDCCLILDRDLLYLLLREFVFIRPLAKVFYGIIRDFKNFP
jgi:hypothetical protein